MKYFLIILFSFLGHYKLIAQDLPSIQLDRPDLTECPFITPAHFIQIEAGLLYERSPFNDFLTTPTVLWKYGINNKTELRLITSVSPFEGSGERFSPLLIGFKTKLIEEKGWIPQMSIIAHLALAKFADKDLQANYTAPLFRFTMQHTISDGVVLAYNLGMEWDGFTAEPLKIYTLTTGISLSDKFGCFVELFGNDNRSLGANHSVDGGLTFLLNDDSMLDVSVGRNLFGYDKTSFVSCGYSCRFEVIKPRSLKGKRKKGNL